MRTARYAVETASQIRFFKSREDAQAWQRTQPPGSSLYSVTA